MLMIARAPSLGKSIQPGHSHLFVTETSGHSPLLLLLFCFGTASHYLGPRLEGLVVITKQPRSAGFPKPWAPTIMSPLLAVPLRSQLSSLYAPFHVPKSRCGQSLSATTKRRMGIRSLAGISDGRKKLQEITLQLKGLREASRNWQAAVAQAESRLVYWLK